VDGAFTVTSSKNITRPGTATAFPLRLRLHYKAARAGGVKFPRRDYETSHRFWTSNTSFQLARA